MTAQLQHIVQKIFSKNSLEEVSLEELDSVVKKYPYFSIGHLLLLQKQKALNNQDHHLIAKRTSLYFQDPLWLQWLMDEEPGGRIEESEVRSEESGVRSEEPEVRSEESGLRSDRQSSSQETEDSYQQDRETTPIDNLEAPVFHEQVSVEENTGDEKESEPERNAEAHLESSESKSTAFAHSSLHTPHSSPDDSTTQPAFEPYHTIDYFASQGIKISNEIKADDKFGQQLKSFTEWLKTMKRFPQPKPDEEVDEIEKSHIREIAEHSLQGKEVVTEAMAEVLVKQHRTEEARQVYEKLSLLNPSKSAYFAAKIEQLKEN